MKLRLRKPWFVAVMAAIATMPALHAANLTVDVTSYTDSTLNVSGTLKLIPTRISEGSEAVTYEWTPTSTTATMTGAGTITNLDSISKYDAPIINVSAYLSPDWDVNQTLEATNATHSISVGNVTFDDSALFLNVRGTHDINATFTNLGTLGLMQCTADLTDAKFSKQADLSLYKATVIAPRDGLIVSNDLRLMSDGYLVSDKPRDASNYITGDVTLAGGGLWPGLTGNPQNLTLEQYRTYKGGVIFSWFGCIDASVVSPPIPEIGYPGSATYMYYDFPTLEISGKLSVTEETGISICFNPTLKETYPEATALPSEDTPIFICLQFTGDQKLLKPYQLTPNEASNDFISHTFLENYEFEIRTGEGGKTYIYLVGGMSTPPTGGGGGGGSSPIDPPTGDEGDDIDPIDPPSGGEDPNPEIPPSSLSYEILTKEQQNYSKPILKVNGDTPLYATGAYDYEWNNPDGTTLTIEGSGTVSPLEDDSSEAWMTVHLTNSQTASIGGDITFDYVCLDLYGGTYDIDSTFTNGAAVYLTDAAANINDATFTNASQLSLSNSTLNCDTLTVSKDLHLQAYTTASTINGNLVLNGGVVNFDWYESDSGAFPTLTVTGSITIQAATQICFSNVPTPENYLFIANSVNEEKLNLLAAYTEDMYANTIALEGYEFGTSVSDKDGKVRIYLVEMDTPGDEGGEGGGSDPIDPPSGGEGGGSDPIDPPSGGEGGGSDPIDPPSGGEGGGSDPIDPPSGGEGGGSDPIDPPSGGEGGGSDPIDPPSGGEGGGSDPIDPPSGGGDEGSWITYRDNHLTINGKLAHYEPGYEWRPTGKNPVLDGTGTIEGDMDILIPSSEKATIGSGLTFKNAIVVISGGDSDVNCTLENTDLEVLSKADIRDVKYKGYNRVYLSAGEITTNTLVTSDHLGVYSGTSQYNTPNIIHGNLQLNGGGFYRGKVETLADFWRAQSGIVIESETEDFGEYRIGTLKINGTLSITAETGVVFVDMIPPTDANVFICNSLSGSLSLLKPYLYNEDDDEYSFPVSSLNFEFLSNKEFEATTENGLTYVRLIDGVSTPPTGGEITDPSTPVDPSKPTVPSFDPFISEGEVINITTSTPSIVLQGGTADATQAPDSKLNLDNITGSDGDLITTPQQKFSMVGRHKLGFSIVGADGTAGADLEIGSDEGDSSHIFLEGGEYRSRRTNVRNANVTIGDKTTLGAGKGSKLNLLGKGSNATNFGKVAADVYMGSGSTFLNQGTVEGMIDLANNSLMTNNGEIDGDVIIRRAAKVYGSGSYTGDTVVKTAGMLYIGNSPGFQRHNNVTLENKSTLGFYIDGTTPAGPNNTGAGTHSFMIVSGALTIDGIVNVELGIGRGILNAGNKPFMLTLMQVDNPEAISSSDKTEFVASITEGAELLKEGSAELTWEEELGRLIFTGQVDEGALIVRNGAAYANTLWASTSTVKDFVDTASSQQIIGTPGQTTAWGAAIGTFMDMKGSSGFNYNGGGFAVGVQHACTEEFRAGISLGRSFGQFEGEANTLTTDQSGIMAAITAQYVSVIEKGQSSMILSTYAAYGNIENDIKGVPGKNGDWRDEVFSAGLRADWLSKVGESSTLTFFVGLDYIYGTQEDICMNGSATAFTDGSMQRWSVPVGFTLRTETAMGACGLFAPELTVAYVGDISANAPRVKSAEGSIHGANPGRSAFMLNVGANWLFNENWSVGLFYNLEVRKDMTNQSGNFSLRYSF